MCILQLNCSESHEVGEGGVLSADVSAASNEARVVVGEEFDRGELLKAVQAVGYDIYREDAVISLRRLEADDARLIETAASRMDGGVFKARVNLGLNQVLVTYNPPLEVEPRELAEELRRMGGLDVVAVSSYDEADIDEKAALIDLNDIRTRLMIALPPLTAALFVAASLNYLGVLGNELYNLVGFMLATPIQFYSGWRFMRGVPHSRCGTARPTWMFWSPLVPSALTSSAYTCLPAPSPQQRSSTRRPS